MVIKGINAIGNFFIDSCTLVGDFALFLFHTIKTIFTTRPKIRLVFIHMEQIGVGAFAIIFLTGFFTGAVLALQSYLGFKQFNAEDFIGPVVAWSITRELGPVLTALMVTGRSGSAMAAEIGTMRITEQIDALQTLCINRFQYLIAPRIIASTIIMPFLTIISMICGIIGGYYICVYRYDLNAESYISLIKEYIELSDITGGLKKASMFGFILSLVGTYTGYITSGGARGVGSSTTKAVVSSSILILITNYFLSALLFKTST